MDRRRERVVDEWMDGRVWTTIIECRMLCTPLTTMFQPAAFYMSKRS